MIKISERTLYEPITKFLEQELKAKSISEVRIEKGWIDILFKLDSYPFVLEIKVGEKERALTEAVAQAWEYASQIGYETRNVIALVFSRIKSGQIVLDEEKFKEQILSEKVRGYIHTEYLDKWVEDEQLKEVLIELSENFKRKVRNIDFNSIVKAIREIVQDLYEVIRQAKVEEIFEEVSHKLELFTSLGEIKDEQKAKTQVSMLASYLLFNQLLFYHIYSIKAKEKRVEELKPIKSLNELEKYFSKILEIDYQPIYNINLIDKIPERVETIELINRCIKNLLVIRVEHITQDLAGRFFHALLPREVAKVWAAFYTNPIAAEILARLSIDRWDETILDPACGSGTLLTASYRRKLELYEKQTGKKLDENTISELHKRFIENDITGIDIMPFAAHLTTINLAAQRLDQPTDNVRIACMDALELAAKTQTIEFKEKGILLKPLTEVAQYTLTGKKIPIRKAKTLSTEGIGKEFYLKPVDVVIMNPPFSDRDKLPKEYREKLKDFKELGDICGHQINLWGYFLALAHLFLKPNGKIAAVLPINLARGGATKKIRNFLIKNYYIKFIVKPVSDLAFSESAAFRDILLIAEKRRPKKSDITKIIFLKKSVREMKDEDVYNVINFDKDYLDVREITYEEILKNKENLMPFLLKSVENIFEKINSSQKLSDFDTNWIEIGLPYRPKGVADGIFITNPLDESRIKNAFSILYKTDDKKIIVTIKGLSKNEQKIELEKDCVAFALRTNTGIKKISVYPNELDFVLVKKKDKYLHSLKKLSTKIPIPFPWEEHLKNNIVRDGFNLVIPRKIGLSSPNIHVVSIFSDKKMVSAGPSLWYFKNNIFNIEELKILNLYFNSI
ncbi:MAG: N-6 DNA methylase, partial [Candidatus Aenigmatarchaeota archaeon]